MGYLSRVLYKSSAVHENGETPFGFWRIIVAFAEDHIALSFFTKVHYTSCLAAWKHNKLSYCHMCICICIIWIVLFLFVLWVISGTYTSLHGQVSLLEWTDDIEVFVLKGYGESVNYHMGVPLLQDVVHSMEQAISAEEGNLNFLPYSYTNISIYSKACLPSTSNYWHSSRES